MPFYYYDLGPESSYSFRNLVTHLTLLYKISILACSEIESFQTAQTVPQRMVVTIPCTPIQENVNSMRQTEQKKLKNNVHSTAHHYSHQQWCPMLTVIINPVKAPEH